MQHSLIKEVNQATQKWLVKVRLVRFSEHRTTDDPSKVIALNLVMLDEEGKSMECSIPGRLLPEFQAGLKENSIYFVHCFEVAPAKPKYRLVDHPYMARFTKYTKIKETSLVQDTFPLYACTVLTFAGLRARSGKTDILSDTVGLFVRCSHVKLKDTKTGKRPLRNVFITDGSENANVALWGLHAERFEADKYIDMSKRGPLVFLFTGLTPGSFNGELSLQASPTASWYANPTLREAVDLQDRFGYMVAPAQYDGHPQVAPQEGDTTVEDLSKQNNPHDIWGNKYVVTAEIKNLIPNETWWYMACKNCLHRSKPYGVQYKCNGYECGGTDAEPRYRLGLIAVHPGNSTAPDAPSIDLVCFGPVAEELVGIPVQALIDSGAGTQGFMPPQITRLCGRQYKMTLSVPRAALRREHISFKIDSISVALAITDANPPPQNPVMEHADLQTSGSGGAPSFETPGALPAPETASTSHSPLPDDTIIAADQQIQPMPLPSPAAGSYTPPPIQTPESDLTTPKYAADRSPMTNSDKKKEKSNIKRQKKSNVSRELFPEGPEE